MPNWGALGKQESKFGKCLSKHKISTQKMANESGYDRGTVGNARKPGFTGHKSTKSHLVRTLNRLADTEYSVEDFWT